MSERAGGAEDAVRELYEALEGSDVNGAGELVNERACVFTSMADGVITDRGAFVADLRRWHDAVTAKGNTLRVRSEAIRSSTSETGHTSWVFDQVVVEELHDASVVSVIPVRVTALLANADRWRIESAYWSIPFATQEEQDNRKHEGRLEPGVALEDAISPEAQPIVNTLIGALREPETLPELYSIQQDQVTIGSVVDEVFLGPAARSAWEEFVGYHPRFEVRGGIRAGLVEPTVGWLVTNVDITFDSPTPYRFFYIWRKEPDGWRIAVSHDSVSVDPCTR